MEPGAVLGGKYRLVGRLGRGGMGEVWSAIDQDLDRLVAVKILLSGLDTGPGLIARLRREAKTAAGLQHPGITVVHDIGEHDGHPFFVMERLNGIDLSTLLAVSPGGLPIDRVVSLAIEVADALAHAHRRGVVHRDIKPANLMELDGGGVKICDFGISRYADVTAGLTAPDGAVGTPAYMAPEQYQGKPVDARTDLYAFGCTLHALLSGAPPFTGESMAALMHQHLNAGPPNLTEVRPEVPAGLAAIVLDLLAKNPGDRPASATHLGRRLRSLAADGEPRPTGGTQTRSPGAAVPIWPVDPSATVSDALSRHPDSGSPPPLGAAGAPGHSSATRTIGPAGHRRAAFAGRTDQGADQPHPAQSVPRKGIGRRAVLLAGLAAAVAAAWVVVVLPATSRSPVSPRHTLMDDGRAFGAGGSSHFTVAVDPASTGVRLTRRLDAGIARQSASITVNGARAGAWPPLPGATTDRWRDQSVDLPPSLTTGRSTLTINNTFVSSSQDFNEFAYFVDQKVDGVWSRADTVDVGPGHPGSEAAHHYHITAPTWSGTQNFTYP